MKLDKSNIHKYISGTWLDCRGKGITSIEDIPDYITSISCYKNKLTQLPKLPDSLVNLYCYGNQLTSLPKLPDSLINLYCSDNNLPYEITLDNLKEHNNRIKLSKRSKIINKIL